MIPYHYFCFIAVLACISISNTIVVNGFDLFQLTDIYVFVNWNNVHCPTPMERKLPDVAGSLVASAWVNSCKVEPEAVCLAWSKRPTLA